MLTPKVERSLKIKMIKANPFYLTEQPENASVSSSCSAEELCICCLDWSVPSSTSLLCVFRQSPSHPRDDFLAVHLIHHQVNGLDGSVQEHTELCSHGKSRLCTLPNCDPTVPFLLSLVNSQPVFSEQELSLCKWRRAVIQLAGCCYSNENFGGK